MKIGLVTQEITRVTNELFWMRRQNSANISPTTGPIFANFSALVHVCRPLWGLQNLHKFRSNPRDVAMVTD